MKPFSLPLYALIFLISLLSNYSALSQTYDTISNWDNITQDWELYGQSAEVVDNPSPDNINSSVHCYKVVTADSQWDNISYLMAETANFDYYYKYRIKVLAPETGGDVTLKFQNENNTYAQEIVRTPIPGQWTDLEFDFSGLPYSEFVTMVIFFDFKGTVPGIDWYLDDVIKVEPAPILLESNLPIIIIDTYGVSIPDEPKTTGHMGVIFKGEGAINHVTDPFNNFSGNIAIETRGHSTQMFPKKSYGFETRDNLGENLAVSLLGMPEESDWILYGPYSDKSMLRNVVSFEMGHKMNDLYCSRTVYCELIVNNDYKGVYVLMEKIKKDENRIDIATLKPDEISGDDITGGYILAVDWHEEGFTYNVDGWLSNPNPSYPGAKDIVFAYYYPEPEEIVNAQRNYIKTYITSAEDALIGSNFDNSASGYHKYFDVPSFVDQMLLSEISKEVDKYRVSQYFYKEKDSDGGKLFAGPAWDFNLGYGNVDYWEPGINTTGWVYSDVQPVDWSIMYWWKRLMEDDYFKNLAKTRWISLRQNELTDYRLHTLIDSLILILDNPKERNYERWPILGTYVWPNYNWYNNTYEDEVQYFSNFLFNRVHWMDSFLPGVPLNPGAEIWAEGNKVMVELKGDYFRNQILLPEFFKLNNVPTDIVIQDVEYRNASECILTLSGIAANYQQLSVKVDEKAINTWTDLVSNTLATAGYEEARKINNVRIHESDGKLVLLAENPELLPDYAEIFNLSGQCVSKHRINKDKSNVLNQNLKPGLYILILRTSVSADAYKFIITN